MSVKLRQGWSQASRLIWAARWGGVAGKLFAEAGARVVAVQDHTGTIYRTGGLDVPALLVHVRNTGGVAGFTEAEAMADADFWRVDCEILIPAALEGQINASNAGQIRARLLIEGANGPTSGLQAGAVDNFSGGCFASANFTSLQVLHFRLESAH